MEYLPLFEDFNNSLTVYHGTLPKFVDEILRNGLEDRSGAPYEQGWYVVRSDFESALFHANSDDNKDYVYVIEFKIPVTENDRWLGYPYLWEGATLSDTSTWYALMQKLPKEFITKVHKVDYDKWFAQKTTGLT